MDSDIVPVKEQLEALLNGEAEDLPLDTCQSLDLECTLPAWFDKDKYKRGQAYIKRNMFAQYAVTLHGLVMVLSVPSILHILMGTKKSSTLKTAYRRYVSTTMHVFSWYEDELKPGTKAWKSLITVRSRHLRASKTSQRKHSPHISQRDLALTQFGFYGLGLVRAKMVGMQAKNDEDIEGYIHFWRTIGYMMGICDKYNLCRPSIKETVEVTEAICKEVYLPLLYKPPEYFLYMTVELLKAMTYLIPVMTAKALLYFSYTAVGVPTFYKGEEKNMRTLKTEEGKVKLDFKPNKITKDIKMTNEEINGNEIYSGFSWYDRFVLYLHFLINGSGLSYWFLRIYFNFQITIIMFFITYFPFGSFYRFGFRGSYVNMFSEDVPMDYSPKTNKEMVEWFVNSNSVLVKSNNNNIETVKAIS